ncbi:MAG: histidinol-phosphate transaminase [Solirubrobacterales bacterium]
MTYSKLNIALLDPYIPGYQPDRTEKVIKLNTNENPYPPSPKVKEALSALDYDQLRLYPKPDSDALREKLAEVYGLSTNQIFCGNGCDEIIGILFRTFVEANEAVLLAYPTYSYYRTQAEIHDIIYKMIDTDDQFRIQMNDYLQFPSKMTILCNPNAPTSMMLDAAKIERFLERYRGLLVVDETYIDFAGTGASIYRLIERYENLIVLRTLSKSFSLCGIRVGYAFANPNLIRELNKVKDSYNLNAMSQAAAIAALSDLDHMAANVETILRDRSWLRDELAALGFDVLPSQTNFLFARHRRMTGSGIYQALAERRIFVRYFDERRISNFLRITVGTHEEITELLEALREILGPEAGR